MLDDFELNLRFLAFWDQWVEAPHPGQEIYILDKRTLRIYGSYENLIRALRKDRRIVEYWQRNLIRCPRVPYLKAVELRFEPEDLRNIKNILKQNPNKIVIEGDVLFEELDLPDWSEGTELRSLYGQFHFVWNEEQKKWILEDIKFENDDDYEYVK